MSDIADWRPIPEVPYMASDLGEVRRHGSARILRPFRQRGGYLLVKLSINGYAENRLVHELIALAFLGARPSGMQINHRDGDKSNNRPANLEYVTASENMKHAIGAGLVKPPPPVRDYKGSHWTTLNPERVRGEGNSRAMLTEEQVRKIRELRPTATLAVLAARFGVSTSLISNICNRKAWSHVA